MKVSRWLLCCVTLAVSFCAKGDEGRECRFPEGPSNYGNVLEPPSWPAHDLDKFAGGQLGIIRPTYHHFYLFIAYRNLLGLPLSITDINRIRRHDPCWHTDATGYHGYYPKEEKSYIDAVSMWVSQREKVTLPRRPSKTNNSLSRSGAALICNADAFRNAGEVLASRLARYGQSPEVLDWVNAQDSVFANCDGPAAPPRPVPESAPRWLQLDRDYQVAAANFYAGDYDQAVKSFDAIAANADSPWRHIAPYLAVRAIIRSATTKQEKTREPLDLQILGVAESRLKQILHNRLSPDFQKDVERLLQFVQIRTRPAEVLTQIEERLTAKELPESVGQDITDFWVAYLKRDGANAPGPFSQWLSALGFGGNSSFAYAQWRKSASLPWLVVALIKADANTTPEIHDLLADASKIPASSPAYLTARYHLARLSEPKVAIKNINKVLKLPATTLTSQDANTFLRLGLTKAKSIVEFAHFAPREQAMAYGGIPPNVDEDTVDIFNRSLPLDSMAQILSQNGLPKRFRHELTRVVWVRAFVLDRWDLIQMHATELKSMIPESAASIDAMIAENDLDTRRAIGAMVLARYPGMVGNVTSTITANDALSEFAHPNMHRSMSQDGDRANWWCGFPSDVYYVRRGWKVAESMPPPPAFLSPKAVAKLMKERRKLEATPNATNYLSKIVMEWARKHPRDPLLPQALHMLVRSSRGGCVHNAPSAAMFRHLHKYFPTNPWAKETKVHY